MGIPIEQFCEDGFLAIRGAVAPEVVRECVASIEVALREQHVDLSVPATWTQPVVRIACPWGPAFKTAGTSPLLHSAYDALLGIAGWVQRPGVGGTVPVRFPSTTDPGDAGWHVDGSYSVEDQYWVNIHSRERGLLALFLFSDVGNDDAPTEILVGSHLEVPRVLASHGEQGTFFGNVTAELGDATFERRRALATGRAGDVYLCHPFLVHRATWPHRGTRPRILAQPAVATRRPFALKGDDKACAVERSILRALAS